MAEEKIVSEVRQVGEPGTSQQWARGPFYRQDGKKLTANPKAFAAVSFGLFILGALASFVTETAPTASSRSSMPKAEVHDHEEKISVPAAAAGTVQTPTPTSVPQHGQSLSQGKTKLRKLQVVKRANATEVPPGSMFKAKLVSGASNGPLRAEVIEPLVVDGETRIGTGAVLIGMGQSTEQRLFIKFNQLVFKDGSFQEFQAQACDNSDQTVGLKGDRVGSYAIKLAAAAALNFAGGVSEGLQESDVQNGVAVRKTSMKNALLNGSAHAALDQAKDTMSSVKSEAPIIEVPAGTVFLVLAQGG
ncbi:MAG: hypothetical protein NTV34_17785 [Proteobacteria bacterium]|nr:hypothetical protein [Pseudomonadota bacterium]